ncbi:ATP-grasp domain-containing protein [Abyssisolibacter fermentans]|uniref:ATP-grasp domain-containing protein n=1 Tax=Abyssisolibacter fermentans TaxID=1766203 RepID=UPI00082DBB7F|nr:ATP-grasp domain-containing protein [Abyssisolibacter fermentans]
MAIFIINRSKNPEKYPYYTWLEDVKEDMYLLTREEAVEQYGSYYPNIIGFDNFINSDLLYYYIEKNINTTKTNYLVSIHEYDLIKAGYVRERYNILGQDSTSAIAFRNKVKMKDILKGIVKLPDYLKIKHIYELIDFIKKFDYPVVIKPIDMAASIDVSIINNENDLKVLLNKGIKQNWEIEKFISENMYHVDGLYRDGKLLLCRSSRYINNGVSYQSNKFLGSVMLNKNNANQKRLEKTVRDILVRLPTPISTIAFHAEFFITNENEIVFCEIASRVGGAKVETVMEYATGVNLTREWVRGQCGINSHNYSDLGKQGGWILIPPQNGKLVDINTNFPYKDQVISFEINKDLIGKEFNGANSSVDKIAAVAVKGESEEEIEALIWNINNWFIKNTEWLK